MPEDPFSTRPLLNMVGGSTIAFLTVLIPFLLLL